MIRRVHEQARRALAAERHRVDGLAHRPEDDESAIGRPLIQAHRFVKWDEQIFLSTGEILHEYGAPPGARRDERQRAFVRGPRRIGVVSGVGRQAREDPAREVHVPEVRPIPPGIASHDRRMATARRQHDLPIGLRLAQRRRVPAAVIEPCQR